jgi:hypothetical protein
MWTATFLDLFQYVLQKISNCFWTDAQRYEIVKEQIHKCNK